MALGIDVLRYSNAFWESKRSQVGSNIVPKIGLGGVSGGPGGSWEALDGQHRKKRRATRFGGPSWFRLGAVLGLSWALLASKMEPKSKHKCIWKSIKQLLPLEIDFWKDIDGFCGGNGCKLAPKFDLVLKIKSKFDQNSILSWKCRKAKRAYETNRISLILGGSGVQVGSQNRSKIDQKIKSRWEAILASNFERFGKILEAKLGPKIE